MGEANQLGELQYAIMRVLWAEGEATVARVQEVLATEGERDRALTTVATMLTKMEKKGIVSHRTEGRQFVYRAKISEAAVQRSMVAALTERLFEGDFSALVSHLLTEQEIDAGEVERLKRLIAERGARSGRASAEKERRRGK
jgi:BlaI family penicillinase repressor